MHAIGPHEQGVMTKTSRWKKRQRHVGAIAACGRNQVVAEGELGDIEFRSRERAAEETFELARCPVDFKTFDSDAPVEQRLCAIECAYCCGDLHALFIPFRAAGQWSWRTPEPRARE